MPQTKQLTTTDGDKDKRLDVFLSEALTITRSAAAKLAESGAVTEHGAPLSKNVRLRAGETLTVQIPDPVSTDVVAQDIGLNIVYEDKDLLVINKPKGMVVHPAAGNRDGTLVNALLYHCGDTLSGIGGVIRPGIVHRIDKDTSGLLVVAKHDAAHLALSEQLKDHSLSRVYHAIVRGNLKEDTGTIDAPIGRHPTDRKKMAILRGASSKSRSAVTHYTVLERFGDFTYLRCELETGRTHQIRVHMAGLGHPLIGDTVYGGRPTAFETRHAALLKGQCLHAREISFRHPTTGEQVTFTCPLPDAFETLLTLLRNQKRGC